MTSATNAPLPTPEEYLKSLRREPKASGRNAILYYPGSGTDYGPFRLFAENSKVAKVIYADYLLSELDAREFITHLPGWQLDGEIVRPEPGFFHARTWEDFWPDDPLSRRAARPQSAFALRATLSNSRRFVEFLFLGTEAIQTFSILAKSRLLPTIVVLQDHGFGSGWANFGGESTLFTRASLAGLPQLLLVATNTVPWPGYEQTSEFIAQEDQHDRALFRRVLRQPLNPNALR